MEVKSKFNLAAVIYGSILMLSVFLVIISFPVSASASSVNLDDKIFTASLDHPATQLSIQESNRTLVLVTRAETLNQAFQENDITVPSGTITTPHRLTPLAGGSVKVSVTSASFPVTIIDSQRSYQVETSQNTVKNVLAACNIEIGPADKIFPNLDKKVVAGMRIVIDRATPVVISYGERTYHFETQARTAAEALTEARDKYEIPSVDIEDEILAGVNHSIYHGEELRVSREKVEIKTEIEDLPFEIIYNNDYYLPSGDQLVSQPGQNGQIERTYQVTYADDIEISRELIEENVITQPINQQVTVGQKQPEIVYYPDPVGDVGTASWYYYGTTPTCAHRVYPKGSQLLVTNNSTGAQVVVTVNDYGPAAWTGRIIDLNSVAFSAIAPLGQGLVNVTVTPL